MNENGKRSLENSNMENEKDSRISKKSSTTDLNANRLLTTVLVKNLPRSYNNNKIKKLFQDCGMIKDIDTSDTIDRKGRYARLEFMKHDDALAALTKTFKMVGSNEIEVTLLENCTLWITNFPPNFSSRDIRNIFLDIGIVPINIRLPSRRYNSNRRFCYLDVTSEEVCKRSVEMLNGKLIGSYELVVKLSNPSEKTKRTDAAILERRELFVRNLSPTTLNKESLEKIFNQFGSIEHIGIPNSNRDMQHGCAFITFFNKEEANEALQLDKTDIDGKTISVQFSDNKPYLERQEVKAILNSKNFNKLEKYVSLFPISDKISKEQICDFIINKSTILKDDIEKIYLVSDYSGSLIKFRDAHLSAKCRMSFNGTKFQNKPLHIGGIQDLIRHNSRHKNKDSIIEPLKFNNIVNTTHEKEIPKASGQSTQSTQSTPQEGMTNDDFRKMFLGL